MKQLLRKFFVWILAICARTVIKSNKPFIIGVTGSVGKTSCRIIVASVLQKLLPQESVYTSQKNFNSEIGLSLSILGIESYEPSILGTFTVILQSITRVFSTGQYPSILVLEYGIDKPGDMDELTSICVPDISILTSIDSVHAENFINGKEGIYNEKIKLLSATKDIIVVNDTVIIDENIKKNKTILHYADIEGSKNSWFSDYNVIVSGEFIKSSFIYSVGQSSNSVGQNKITITSNIVGLHNIAYITLGLTIGDILGHRKGYTNIALEQAISFDIQLQPGRFTLFHGVNNSIIVDSTYNASSSSMRATISEGIQLRNRFFSDYEIICVLGEMREIGDASIHEHKDLGVRLSDKVNIVIGVSGNSVYVTDYLIGLQDVNKQIFWVDKNIDVVPILHSFLNNSSKKYIIIMKSSQGEIFLEESIKPFVRKEDYSLLARQETYRLQKKRFLHKIIE